MAEISDQYLAQQAEVLRDIRDELRGSNRHAGAPTSGGGYGGLRPSPGVIKAQMTADKILAGEWASFGWSNGYQSAFKSSLTNDILAVTGLGRSPNTLTQMEFQDLAGQNLTQRVLGTAGSLIAPSFAHRSAEFGQDLFANSSRFIRFGNPNASILGTGFSLNASNRLAREIQVGALRDMRLSGEDMSTIASTGMRSGQFDQVGNTSDFKNKLSELAQATADLTRSMRMSVGEVSQMMGNLRTVGITDVSEQRRIGNQIMATAQVAGMTSQEVMGVAASGGVQAQHMGLGWRTGANLAMQNLATVRSASQVGMISPTLMAMGGGAEGIQGSISSAQMQWMTSDSGYMQMLGGVSRGGDAYGSLMKGVAATGGTLSGVLAAQAGKVEILSKMGSQPGVIDRAYAENLKGQLRLMGITDFTSGQARDAVVAMTRGSMGEAGALAYARTEFSQEGLRIKDAAQLNTFRAEDTIAGKLQHDNWYQANSTRGKIQAGIKEVDSWGGRLYNAGMNFLDPGQGGFGGFGGQFSRDLNAVQQGAVPDSVRMADYSMAFGSRAQVADPATVEFQGGAGGATAGVLLGGVGGGYIGARVGMWAGRALGSLLGSALGPVGTFAGGVAGGYAGMKLGMMLGGYAGDAMGSTSPVSIGGPEARDYIAVAKASAKSTAGQARGRELVNTGALANDSEFADLSATADRTGMDVNKSREFAAKVTSVARRNKISTEDVVGALKVQGMQIGMTNAFELAGEFDSKALTEDMGKLLGGSTIDANMAISSNAAALKDYLGAVQSGDQGALQKSRTALADIGVRGDGLDTITKNFRAQDSGTQVSMLAHLGGAVSGGASVAVNRALRGAARFAEGVLDEAESAGVGGVSSARTALRGTAENRNKFLDLLDGGSEGASLRAVLGQKALFRGVMDVGKGIDLQKASARDIAAKYHEYGVTAEAVEDVRKRGGNLKRGIQMQMLNAQGEKEAEASGATKEAALLNDAARILMQLGKTLKIETMTST